MLFVALTILVGRLPGGWPELIQTARAANKFQLFNFSLSLTYQYTFWAGLIGGMVLNTATHGADQMMVQRYLSARSNGKLPGPWWLAVLWFSHSSLFFSSSE